MMAKASLYACTVKPTATFSATAPATEKGRSNSSTQLDFKLLSPTASGLTVGQQNMVRNDQSTNRHLLQEGTVGPKTATIESNPLGHKAWKTAIKIYTQQAKFVEAEDMVGYV